jgi:hypothetical protein
MAVQTVSGRLIADGSITNAKVNAAAAIAYSKLNLSDSILNADINTAADIDTSKLSLDGDFRHVVPNEAMNYTPDTSAIIQDISAAITGTVSTGPTDKGIVVLEADQNFVPRGVKWEWSLDDVGSGELDSSLTGDEANQSVYMRLTNTEVVAQPSTITGVSVGYVEEGNTAGNLTYTVGTTTLQWKSGTGLVLAADGMYILDDGAGNRIVVEVTFASLNAAGGPHVDALTFTPALRGGLFYRKTTDGSEVPLKTPVALNPWRLAYPQIHGIDDLPYLAFFGVGNATDGNIENQHNHVLANITDVTTTASELNQALDGINATVDAAALNVLTGGIASDADGEHTHASLTPPSHQIDVYTASAAQTDFNLSAVTATEALVPNSEHVTIEGVKQALTTHYTIETVTDTNDTVRLTSGALVGETVIAQYMYL